MFSHTLLQSSNVFCTVTPPHTHKNKQSQQITLALKHPLPSHSALYGRQLKALFWSKSIMTDLCSRSELLPPVHARIKTAIQWCLIYEAFQIVSLYGFLISACDRWFWANMHSVISPTTGAEQTDCIKQSQWHLYCFGFDWNAEWVVLTARCSSTFTARDIKKGLSKRRPRQNPNHFQDFELHKNQQQHQSFQSRWCQMSTARNSVIDVLLY